MSLAADDKEPLVTSEVTQSVSDAVEISGRTVVSSVTALALPPSEIVHKVKKIKFLGKEAPIITQNNNGPCPLLAVVNALLLKGDVELGVSGDEVTGGHLVGVVGNALIDLPPHRSSSADASGAS